jgi:hypothetical protein
LIFLAHQTMLALDAVARALVRRFVTQDRLLEWETAAESELNTRGPGPVDVYLSWMPVLSIILGLLVWAVRPQALPAALPILSLWACSKMISSWLNRPPATTRKRSFPAAYGSEDVAILCRVQYRGTQLVDTG